MAPGKSTSRSSRASKVAPYTSQSIASSSKTTLDGATDVPESLTPGYVPVPHAKRELDEDERGRLIHELIGFHPRTILDDFTEKARVQIYPTVGAVEGWATKMVEGKGDEYQREVDIGLHSLETLLESHVDKAFDKFTAWALRNAFEIPSDNEVALPNQRGLDFYRAEHVTSLQQSDTVLQDAVATMRNRVEQARLVSQRLIVAEKALDRRIELAKQRKTEIGFIKEVLEAAGLSPLQPNAQKILSSLTALHTNLSPLEVPRVSVSMAPQATSHTKAWELGRQAYLNWAVGKMVGSDQGVKAESKDNTLEAVRIEMSSHGGSEGLDRLSKSVATG